MLILQGSAKDCQGKIHRRVDFLLDHPPVAKTLLAVIMAAMTIFTS
jgi:hypothetical protein